MKRQRARGKPGRPVVSRWSFDPRRTPNRRFELLESRELLTATLTATEGVNGSPFSGNQVESAADDALASVTGRYLFYNESKYDDNTAGIDSADSVAIAIDKSAYLPGDGMITSAGVSAYSRGINGIMVDLNGDHGTLGLDDFAFKMSGQGAAGNNTPGTWESAPTPIGFTVLADTPAAGTDRIEFIWTNNEIENRYLEVTVKGNDTAGNFDLNTGLPASDVFYFGSRIGDDFNNTSSMTFLTSAADEFDARSNPGFFSSVFLFHVDGNSTFYPAAADTDEARGTAFRNAATAAVAGETVLLGPGTFNIDATIAAVELAPGVTIKGAGMDVTIIESAIGSGLVNDRTLLEVADNVTLQDFTFHATSSSGAYQFPVGRLRPGSFSNVVMRRVKIFAPYTSDAFYTWTTQGSSLYLYDCDFRSAYDTIAFLSSNVGDSLYAENCYFESMGQNWIGNLNGVANNLVNKAGNFQLVNCRFKSRNNPSGSLRTVGVLNRQDNAVTTLINCEFDTSAADGIVFDLFRPSGGSGGFVISGGHGSGPNGEITTSGGNVTYLPPTANATAGVPATPLDAAPQGSLLPITNIYDYNKDGLVSAADQIIARNNAGFQSRINIAGPPPAPAMLDDDGSESAIAPALAVPRTLGEGNSAWIATRPAGFDPNPAPIATRSANLVRPHDPRGHIKLSRDEVDRVLGLDDDLLDTLLVGLGSPE